jgi:predicted DNA-binding protein (MmcQ/YjbR family)
MPQRRPLRPDAVLEKFRGICLSLPGAAEVTKWGHQNFTVGKKIFAAYEKHKGEWAICFKAEPEHQRFLVDADPRFYVSPYVGKHGWVSMKVAAKIRWADVKRFVRGSYALVVDA